MNTTLCPVCKEKSTSKAYVAVHGMCGYCVRTLPADSVLKPKQRTLKRVVK